MLGLVPGMSRLAGGGRRAALGRGTAKVRVLSREELVAWGLGVEEWRRGGGHGEGLGPYLSGSHRRV